MNRIAASWKPLLVVPWILATALMLEAPQVATGAPELDDPPAEGVPQKPKAGKPSTRKTKQTPSGKKRLSKKHSKEKPPSTGSGEKIEIPDLPPDEQAELDALTQLGPGFKLKRTKHYTILYNTNEQDVDTFGAAVERTFRSCVNYCAKLDVEVKAPKKKLLICYLEDFKQYAALARKLGLGDLTQSQPGVYAPTLNRGMFFNYRNQEGFKQVREQSEGKIGELQEQLRRGRLSARERQEARRLIAILRARMNEGDTCGAQVSEIVVQHEVTHQVLWNIGFHNAESFLANPRWFLEGTATMFEPLSDGRGTNIGKVNQLRLGEYRDLERTGKLPAVGDLLSKPQLFSSGQASTAYAESWALVHYLNRTRREHIKTYVRIINGRPRGFVPTAEAELAAFEKAFGKLDEKWIGRWRAWMKEVR